MIDEKAIDQWALEQATAAIRRQWKFPEGARANGATSAEDLARAAILAYESAKPKEAEGLDALRRETRALAQAQDWRNEAEKAECRALSAEAKLAQAVEGEREACAKVADDHAEAWGLAMSTPAVAIAAAIRARAAAAMGEKT